MSNERKHHTPEEKVAIVRRHLIDRVPVCRFSLICRLGAASRPFFSLKSRQNSFPKGEIHP